MKNKIKIGGAIENPSTDLKSFNIPAKYGKFKLKKKDGEVHLMMGKDKIGVITLPFYTGRFYINVWGLYKENTLIECFTTLDDTLKYAEKSLKPIKIKRPMIKKK
jgi:hypothetical protein